MPGEPVTWGRMKEWAQANKVSDDAIMYVKETDSKIRDLDYDPEGVDGTPEFYVQQRWG